MYKHDYSISRPIGKIVILTDRATNERFFVKESEALAKIIELERKFRI